jgi:hypothetical protein
MIIACCGSKAVVVFCIYVLLGFVTDDIFVKGRY